MEFGLRGSTRRSDVPATKGARTVAQQEYEQSRTIDAPPEEVFTWLSHVGNLPPVVDSSLEGPSAEGVPGDRIRTTLEYPGGEGARSTPRATWQWARESAGWSGARRPGATTRGGLPLGTTAKGAARWWCTSPSGSAPWAPRSRNARPRAATLSSRKPRRSSRSPPRGVRRATDATSAVLTEARGSKRSAKPGFTVLVSTSASAARREGNERLAPCRTGLLSAP